MKNARSAFKALKNNKSGFTIIELLIVITVIGVAMFIWLRWFNFGATANDYATDMSLDAKSISTNVFRQLKAQDPWSEMATTIGANATWVEVNNFLLKSDGSPVNLTERNKLGVYAKQFDGSTQNLKKWSWGFEKKVKLRIDKKWPASDGLNMQGKTVVKDSITNNTTSILEVCMEVDSKEISLPAGKDKAICVAMDMANSTNIISYSVAAMP